MSVRLVSKSSRKLTPTERIDVFLASEGDTLFFSRREAEELRDELRKAGDAGRVTARYRRVLQSLHESVNKALGASE